jgi:threonine/homoserine/homoserine lactone efflux protein
MASDCRLHAYLKIRNLPLGDFTETPKRMPELLAFAVTSLVIELTPGPNLAYLAILSATEGRRAGFATVVGIAAGLLIVGLAAALGLTAVITTSRWLYELLRWGGILYLLWLAWEGWRGERETSPQHSTSMEKSSRFLLRGLTTNLLNPKAGLFYVAVLPEFVDQNGSFIAQTLMLSMIYVAIATSVHSAIVLLADAVRPWLEGSRRQIIVRRVLSLLLALIAIWLLVATRYRPE